MEYNVNVLCSNCGEPKIISVPLGTTLKDYMRVKSEQCSNCKYRIIIYTLQ